MMRCAEQHKLLCAWDARAPYTPTVACTNQDVWEQQPCQKAPRPTHYTHSWYSSLTPSAIRLASRGVVANCNRRTRSAQNTRNRADNLFNCLAFDSRGEDAAQGVDTEAAKSSWTVVGPTGRCRCVRTCYRQERREFSKFKATHFCGRHWDVGRGHGGVLWAQSRRSSALVRKQSGT